MERRNWRKKKILCSKTIDILQKDKNLLLTQLDQNFFYGLRIQHNDCIFGQKIQQ
jgi:hypothetical protein